MRLKVGARAAKVASAAQAGAHARAWAGSGAEAAQEGEGKGGSGWAARGRKGRGSPVEFLWFKLFQREFEFKLVWNLKCFRHKHAQQIALEP